MQVSYIGMQTVETAIKPNVKVYLKSDTEMLEEVMVVAYGTAKKSAFTGSASVMKSETLEKRQVSNLTNALSGAVSGVQTTSSNGQPGTSATVRIRGIGSMSASNAPLYVVDGIPYEGDISAINTQDIESMTVLKDAAAAALYGARGANGVILVTTKKGKSGKATITAEARWGVNSRMIKNYDVMQDANRYMELVYQSLYNGAYYNTGYSATESHIRANKNIFSALGYKMYTVPAGQTLIGVNGKMNPNATLGYSDGTYFYTPDNWADNSFSNELRQEYNVSIRGGSDNVNYYLSAGYLSDNGVIENSGFERISTRLNVDYQAKKWLKVGANMGYTNSISKYPGEQTSTNSSSNAFYIANAIAPVYPMFVRNADGTFQYDANSGKRVYDYGDGYSTNYTRNFMSISNPASDLIYNKTEYLMDIFDAKWFADVDIIDGLKVKATLGLHIDNTRYHDVGNRYYGQNAEYGGSVTQDYTRSYVLDQQYLVTYKKQFGKHNIDALVGYESMEYNFENLYAYGYNMYNDNNWTVSNVIDRINGSGSYGELARVGILSRVSYDFDEKYYGSLSFRRDASSRFHKDNRWGNFWSASFAWVLNKESFLEDVEWIDVLKFKASFGQQGNDGLLYSGSSSHNYYAYVDQFKVTGSDGSFADATLTYKGNKDISWETSNALNVGVDFTLWNGKLDGTIEYFSRQTEDMLYYKPTAIINGYTEYPMNIGSVRNSGLEIELNYTPIETSNLKWTINWNGTMMKNKIIELHPDLEGEMISGSYIYREGESMYQFYMPKWAGVDSETGLAQYWAKDADGKEYKTENWSTAYNTNRVASGDLLPDIYGGLGSTLTAYGFDLSIQCAYQLGGTMYDSGYASFMHSGTTSSIGRNWHKDILNAWTPENKNTDVPRLSNIDSYANSNSSRFYTSSDYFAINNITLGYTLPKKWSRKAGIESIRIYGAADNVALFSARRGFDPRMSFTTATTSTYTSLRTISGGVKLTF
ncbi:MAG: SusC/RagA family TonB-linked outer membrane protein [Bacteroides sp.]|nr:SusC/RagA family TonB-linked outer membrane protein [Bacteroides sp.]MBO5015403.1 SusC/RagA family TonB-linked outer membrane protein [Bacteroidaceae bacterium]